MPQVARSSLLAAAAALAATTAGASGSLRSRRDGGGAGADAGGARLPAVADILSSLELANSYFIANEAQGPGNCDWTRGTYFTGNQALYAVTNNASLLQWATTWAESHGWACDNVTNANSLCCGQTYAALYELAPSPEKLNLRYTLDILQPDPSQDWTWIDAVFMAVRRLPAPPASPVASPRRARRT